MAVSHLDATSSESFSMIVHDVDIYATASLTVTGGHDDFLIRLAAASETCGHAGLRRFLCSPTAITQERDARPLPSSPK
jgi:hypothetical protein